MTDSDMDLTAPELSPDDFLRIDDPHFEPNNVAIVTGAASGIGRATATALVSNGLTVVGADIDTEGLAETGDLVEEFDASGTFHGVETDLTSDAVVGGGVDELPLGLLVEQPGRGEGGTVGRHDDGVAAVGTAEPREVANVVGEPIADGDEAGGVRLRDGVGDRREAGLGRLGVVR